MRDQIGQSKFVASLSSQQPDSNRHKAEPLVRYTQGRWELPENLRVSNSQVSKSFASFSEGLET
jgi:hypothetical protein